jgi:hypothetical protein
MASPSGCSHGAGRSASTSSAPASCSRRSFTRAGSPGRRSGSRRPRRS